MSSLLTNNPDNALNHQRALLYNGIRVSPVSRVPTPSERSSTTTRSSQINNNRSADSASDAWFSERLSQLSLTAASPAAIRPVARASAVVTPTHAGPPVKTMVASIQTKSARSSSTSATSTSSASSTSSRRHTREDQNDTKHVAHSDVLSLPASDSDDDTSDEDQISFSTAKVKALFPVLQEMETNRHAALTPHRKERSPALLLQAGVRLTPRTHFSRQLQVALHDLYSCRRDVVLFTPRTIFLVYQRLNSLRAEDRYARLHIDLGHKLIQELQADREYLLEELTRQEIITLLTIMQRLHGRTSPPNAISLVAGCLPQDCTGIELAKLAYLPHFHSRQSYNSTIDTILWNALWGEAPLLMGKLQVVQIASYLYGRTNYNNTSPPLHSPRLFPVQAQLLVHRLMRTGQAPDLNAASLDELCFLTCLVADYNIDCPEMYRAIETALFHKEEASRFITTLLYNPQPHANLEEGEMIMLLLKIKSRFQPERRVNTRLWQLLD